MSERVFLHSFYVPYADIDQMGFVYYANYLVYFEMARAALLREAKLPYLDMEREGVMLPVVESHCNYRKPAHYDDQITVKTRLVGFKGPRLRIEYEVCRDDELLATGYTVHVCMSPEGAILRPTPALRGLAEAG